MAQPTLLLPLAAWGNFYVIVGSAAAALTGLQFVVIALVADLRRQSTMAEVRTFGTPTIVHFSAVLLVSAILSAPWTSFWSVSISLGSCGAAGVIYGVTTVLRARRQTGYKPVFEDWLWHCMLPLVAYSTLVIGAIALTRHAPPSLFAVAAAVILLLFIGIHNAWDTVTYFIVETGGRKL